jgi:hypothetical protein
VGEVLQLVFQSLIQSHDVGIEASFMELVLKTMKLNTLDVDSHVSLAVNVLDGIADFYSIVANDGSRNGITAKKLILQAVTGLKVQNSNQINLLSKVIGARGKTISQEVKNRKLLAEKQKLSPFLELLARKSPQGVGYISEHEHRDIVDFYENDEHSDILKGHNNCFKQQVVSEDGSRTYFYRSKRVLKVHLCDLLKAAQHQVGYQYCLRSLIKLRPPWVLLAREAHVLTCLCDRCQNVVLHLRPICNFVNKIRTHGSPAEKVAILDFHLSSSLTEFMSKVLHPKENGSDWHRSDCYHQRCKQSIESPCGSQKLALFFEPILKKFGNVDLQIVQHERVKYTKLDGSVGYKFDQIERTQTMSDIVSKLSERMFGQTVHRQPYVEHRLKILMASRMRQEIHTNITENDIVVYSDFSKELELKGQEVCKSEAFGASNVTIQIVGQVFELKVLKPGPPCRVHFEQESQALTFDEPNLDGGSRIQCYEVQIKELDTWYILLRIGVQNLSSKPKIPDKMFGRLGGEFCLRVYSCNLAGLGDFCEISVNLDGDLPFLPKSEHEIPENHFVTQNLTWLAEFFFLSNHGDVPKTWRTITKCKQIGISDICTRFSRNINRCIAVTDTGGENAGSTVRYILIFIINNIYLFLVGGLNFLLGNLF